MYINVCVCVCVCVWKIIYIYDIYISYLCHYYCSLI